MRGIQELSRLSLVICWVREVYKNSLDYLCNASVNLTVSQKLNFNKKKGSGHSRKGALGSQKPLALFVLWLMSSSAGLSEAGKWSRSPREAWLWRQRAPGRRLWWCSSPSLHAHPATHLSYCASSFVQGWTEDAQGVQDGEDAPQSSQLCVCGSHFLAHSAFSTSARQRKQRKGVAFTLLTAPTKTECGGGLPEPSNL